ncbi:MAG: ABC transporter ATP-binding protein [Gammaproteobacteria bacterium]
MTALLQAEHLYRYYGSRCVVDDVGFTLAKGEVLGFLGPNGAGKTTTMQMLCGVLAPDSGRIAVNGADILQRPRAAKTFLGYLPDTPPVYPELTVDEYLHYCARLHRVQGKYLRAAVQKVLQRCGLTHVAQRLIGNLSKGYQQRVGIAQALVHNPDLVVLDEPTAGLDPVQIVEIRELIRELGSEHGVILSTHILSEVQHCCSRVQIIHQGKLVLHENIDGLRQRLNGAAFIVSTQRPADTARLAAVDGVTAVELLSPHCCRVHYRTEQNPAERLAAVIAESGCGLQELTPERQTLEELFLALLNGDREKG